MASLTLVVSHWQGRAARKERKGGDKHLLWRVQGSFDAGRMRFLAMNERPTDSEVPD